MESNALSLGLSPRGHLFLTPDHEMQSRLDTDLEARITRAFERGSGHGLFLLGSEEAATALPPIYAYWREFGARRYYVRLHQRPAA